MSARNAPQGRALLELLCDFQMVAVSLPVQRPLMSSSTSKNREFMDMVNARPVVFDGAIGTQLYERGIYINRSFDDANLTRQDMVRSVHRAYLTAGADVLTTNTFGSNRIKLGRHGLEDKVEAINRAGVQLAREVAGDRSEEHTSELQSRPHLVCRL